MAATQLGSAVAAAAGAIDETYERLVAPLVPAGQPIWDVHAHLGVDEDGARETPEGMLASMRRYGIGRAFVFPFRAPGDRRYAHLNDQVIEWAAASEGALVPFCRVELGDGFAAELERALGRGARGIKLHPNSGVFDYSHPGMRRVLALAQERRVPVLLHAGRGLPPIAAELDALLEEFPHAQVVLAHAGIADMHELGRRLGEHPNLCLDCSVWHSLDVLAALTYAAPEQLVYGADAPYYPPPCAQAKLLLALDGAGASDEQRRDVLWRNAERIARGERASQLSPPLLGRSPALRIERLRAHEYLVMAIPLIWTRQPDPLGLLELARRSWGADDDERLLAAGELLELAERCWLEELASGSRDETLSLSWATFRLVYLADALILRA